MFGRESQPSRVYRFGARIIDHRDVVGDQMYLMHKYRNKLVEIELERRKNVDQLLQTLSPQLIKVETSIAEKEKQLNDAREFLKKQNQTVRSRLQSPEQKQIIRELSNELKPLRSQRKELRTALFESLAFKEGQKTLDVTSNDAKKKARADSKLFWPNYSHVEQSSTNIRSGSPPRFMRYTGGSKVAMAFQGGVSWDELTSGDDRRMHIMIDRIKQPNTFGNANIKFRIGSNENHTPIWANLRVNIHRLPPSDCNIKWAFLVRQKIATHEKWNLQLICSRESWVKHDQASTGSVGIDVGWRLLPEGLRIAYWVGSDGKSGQVIIPNERLDRERKVDDLQSIRDKMFNVIKLQLSSWFVDSNSPDWLKARLKTLGQWKSPSRLASVVIYWRTNRFAGEYKIFDALEAWRKQDKHLYDWQEYQRKNDINWRLDLYRNVAAMLSRQYEIAYIEDTNWSKLAEIPEVEQDRNEQVIAAAWYRKTAAVSIFIDTINQRMAKVKKRDAKNTTQSCSNCHQLMKVDAGKSITLECPHCHNVIDQDENAAKNLLSEPVLV